MQTLLQKRIVPVVVIDQVEDAVPLAKALLAGGLNVIEVTFRTPQALQAMARIVQEVPEMHVGAGTILNIDQVKQAKGVGATFGIAPGLNEVVLQKALDIGLPFVPGIMTPSEIERAVALGFHVLKFFPAEAAGGIKMLEALVGPYLNLDIRFIPTGGINVAHLKAYLSLPMVAAIGGSWFVHRKLIADKNWSKITSQTIEALSVASSVTLAR